MNFVKSLYQYQEERFPVKILFFTTMAVVLSSAAILSYNVNIYQIVGAFVACMAFLFHVRVIDESRDFDHDLKYHPERPVQRGLISIRQLFYIDAVGVIVFITVALIFGRISKFYGAALLLFSFVAWKDFFLRNWLKKKFYLYNAVNMLQMVLLQMLIYSIFTQSFMVTQVMWIHLVFVIFNTIIMEFVRKIKTMADESRGEDTYSWHMGFFRSLMVFYLFCTINIFTFFWMLYTLSPHLNIFYLGALLLFVILTVSTVMHGVKKKKTTEAVLLLSTVLNYVGLNLLIYFYNI